MTWRIDEIALFRGVERELGRPGLDESQRVAVRSMAQELAGGARTISEEAVSHAIAEANRKAAERLAQLERGDRPDPDPSLELTRATLWALNTLVLIGTCRGPFGTPPHRCRNSSTPSHGTRETRWASGASHRSRRYQCRVRSQAN